MTGHNIDRLDLAQSSKIHIASGASTALSIWTMLIRIVCRRCDPQGGPRQDRAHLIKHLGFEMPVKDILLPLTSFPVPTEAQTIKHAVKLALTLQSSGSALAYEMDIQSPSGSCRSASCQRTSRRRLPRKARRMRAICSAPSRSWRSDKASRTTRASCPYRKLKLEHTGDAARPRPAGEARGLFCIRHADAARPCAATGVSGPRCSIFDTMREGGEDVAHQRRLRD